MTMPASFSTAIRAFLLTLPLFASAAGAAEDHAAMRGSAGLVPLPFAARNDGGQPMSCAVDTAHWYAVDLGTTAPGTWLRQMFWTVPATGEVVILNAHDDRMPVEALWCGEAGRAWETRATIDLERRAHRPPAPLDVACSTVGPSLRCAALPLRQTR